MTTPAEKFPATDKLAYSVVDAAKALGVGRSTLYALVGSGELPMRKVGRRSLILRADLERFVGQLQKA